METEKKLIEINRDAKFEILNTYLLSFLAMAVCNYSFAVQEKLILSNRIIIEVVTMYLVILFIRYVWVKNRYLADLKEKLGTEENTRSKELFIESSYQAFKNSRKSGLSYLLFLVAFSELLKSLAPNSFLLNMSQVSYLLILNSFAFYIASLVITEGLVKDLRIEVIEQ